MEYTQHSESPDVFHFWTGISMIAGALRRRVWIDQRWFQWTPNFYIIFVGPPGVVTKSTSAKLGQRILAEIPGIHFGPSSLTWQALIKALSESQEHVTVEDLSVENLLNSEILPMACITSIVSELGTFLNPRDDDMVNILTDLWDGQLGPAWERKTKSSGDASIENPWLNVIGCTTPSWLKRNFPEHLIHGGLTSRTIFIYADKKRLLNAYPSETVGEEAFKAHGGKLIEDLQIIANLLGPYEMKPEAIAWGTEWYKAHWASRPIHMASERFEGYISRKQTHLHKLAMILAAAQRDELIITKNDLVTAESFVTSLEADMHKVFESIGVVDGSRNITEILTFVRVYKKITDLDLWRLCLTTMSKKDYEDALSSCIRANYIVMRNEGSDIIIRPIYDKREKEE